MPDCASTRPSATAGCKCGMIAFVLICVRLGEIGHCKVERVRVTQILRNGDSVTSSGMRPSKGPTTESGIYLHALRPHLFDHGGHFPVT
jgi:hypothetical protein